MDTGEQGLDAQAETEITDSYEGFSVVECRVPAFSIPAAELEVSVHGLRRRIKALGLRGGRL